MSNKHTVGFTILELLLILAVISILGAATLPALITARQRANASSAQVYLRNVALELEALRHSASGALNTSSGLDCIDYIASKPASMDTCTISPNPDTINFDIDATLLNSDFATATYNSISGETTFAP